MNKSTIGLVSRFAQEAPQSVGREIYYVERRELETSAFRGETASFTDSRSVAASVRAVAQRRLGSAFTERIDEESLAAACAAAERNAAFLDEDEGNALYEGVESLSRGCDTAWKNDSLGAEDKKRFALALEAAARARDARIVNVPGAAYGEGDSTRLVATNRGLVKVERHSLCYAYVYVMASAGGETETGSYAQAASDFSGLDATLIVERAVEEALGKLGAREPESGSYRAIIENDAASSLLGAFMSAISAEAIQKGKSRLVGKRGTRVASPLFSLIDNPNGPGVFHAAFDDEGVPASELAVFREGVFLEPLYTVYSARRENATPNGRAFRRHPAEPPAAALINAYIPAGNATPEALEAELSDGILICSVEGLHAGLNPVSGDFSCSARGFRIRGGRRAEALRNFTVSGNFYDLIAGIEACGSDLRTDSMSRLRSPSLLVHSISVSGS